jgi:hypothetical protein
MFEYINAISMGQGKRGFLFAEKHGDRYRLAEPFEALLSGLSISAGVLEKTPS